MDTGSSMLLVVCDMAEGDMIEICVEAGKRCCGGGWEQGRRDTREDEKDL